MTLRLALNARFATRPLSGVDRVAHELTRALVALGDKVDMLALAPRAAALADLPVPIAHGRLGGQAWEQLELPGARGDRLLFSPCNTGPLAVRNQVVLIHDAQPWLHPDAYSPIFRAWYYLLMPRLARRACVVLTVSEYSRTQLERFGVVPPGKAQVVPNGADHILSFAPDEGVLPRHGLISGGYLLALGSLSPHKNLALLMRAAGRRGPDAPPLVVAGGGNSRVFADAGLSPPSGVKMLGRVTDEELRALYQHAIAFLFPSKTEGFGLPPLEAMLNDCPVIASDAGAITEVCANAAQYVSPSDEAGWTRAMIDIEASPERRRILIEAGRRRAVGFTWAHSAEILSDILDCVVGGVYSVTTRKP